MIQNTTAILPRLGRRLLILGTLLGALFGTALVSAQNGSPTDTVKSTVDTLLGILRKPDFNVEAERDTLRAEILKAFDTRAMAQSVLSTGWREATPAQQEEFEDLLLRTIEGTYIGRLQQYTNESVEILGEEVRGNRATVNTHVVMASGNVPVNYKLRQRSDGWFVYDVEVENVSMVSSYRETYRSIVSRAGMDGLLEQMRAKLAELGA